MEDVANICDLAITDKQICVGKSNVMMSGFLIMSWINIWKNYKSRIYCGSLCEDDLFLVQHGFKRFSPGTYFSQTSDTITNNIMSIWIHKLRDKIIFGLSNIDIYTGRSSVFEYDTEFSQYSISCDELERFVHIYRPKEVIIIHNIECRNVLQQLFNMQILIQQGPHAYIYIFINSLHNLPN